MSRGVPLDDPLRTQRLIHWYWEEKEQEITRTMLLVAAISGVDDLDQYARKYIQSIFPTEKTNEEMVEKYRDIVEAEGQKEYTVVSQDS